MDSLKHYLSQYDPEIATVAVIHDDNRAGDIPHSLASIEKAKANLEYEPKYSMQQGLQEVIHWYWENLKEKK